MYTCGDFKGLSVLSLYEGDLLGVVDKLYFSKDLKKLVEIELISEDGAKLILPTKNIYKIGKNAIVVKNNQAVTIKMETTNLVLCPISSKAYSINGEFLGVVKEIAFNEKFATQKISLDNNNVLVAENLASCGKNSIIFNNAQTKVNLTKFKPVNMPKVFKDIEIQTAKTLPIEKENPSVIKPINSAEFLLGRKCSKDIYNFNNEILIKANGTVNKRNLKEIKKFGKLKELMLYCK